MRDLVALGLAGAFGTLARYGVGLAAMRVIGGRFAVGTLIVNVLGCFLLAAIMTAGFSTEWLSRGTKLALTTGFLGAFTTFSTFGYETIVYVERGDWQLAGLNAAANLVLGLLAAAAGIAVGRVMLGPP